MVGDPNNDNPRRLSKLRIISNRIKKDVYKPIISREEEKGIYGDETREYNGG